VSLFSFFTFFTVYPSGVAASLEVCIIHITMKVVRIYI
jgi:hypothetical protein